MSAAITGIAIGAAGLGLAGASAAGVFAPPAPPSAAQQQSALTKQQIKQMPATFQANSIYNPLYAGLNNTVAWDTLFGTAAGTAPTPAAQSGWYDAQGNLFSPGKLVVNSSGGGGLGGFMSSGIGKALNISSLAAPGGGFVGVGLNAIAGSGNSNKHYVAGPSPGSQYTWVEKGGTISKPTEATPGQLAMMAKAQPALLAMQTATRAQNIADVQNLGPAAYQAMRAYDPAVTDLYDTMDQQAQSLVNTNGKLDPFTQQALQQGYRGAEAARGLAGGTGDAAMEAYYQTATQEQRRLTNLGVAGQVAGETASYYGDPFQQVLSRTSGGVQPQPVNYGGGVPNSFNISPGAYGLQAMASGQAYGTANAGWANQQGGIQSLLGATGNLANSLHSYFNPPTSSTLAAGVAGDIARGPVVNPNY